jgi:asparagine synthase (glutamine-hydrolysing)
MVSSTDALSVIPKLPTMFDEPFGDVSQIPTYLVSKLAREHVVVSLSGDGGDELFCGYNRYFHTKNVWQKIDKIPARPIIVRLLKLGQILPASLRMGKDFSHRINSLGVTSIDHLYRDLISHYKMQDIVNNGSGAAHLLWDTTKWNISTSEQERWMWLDAKTYLADDILVKVDRASMAVGLEARVPLLDYRVVEWAWKLPHHFKVSNGIAKYLLKQLLYKYVPQRLIDRPKMGFGVPIEQWLRGPLKEWGNDLLDSHKLNREGYLNVKEISRRWHEHQTGVNSWHYSLWNVLMFESWLEQNG